MKYSQSELFQHCLALSERDKVADYLAMGYSEGTARQLAHLSDYMLRDIGLGSAASDD